MDDDVVRPGDADTPAPVDAAAAAAGGVLGASARWAVGSALDVGGASTGAFPWHTLLVNVTGCLLIGLAAGRLHGIRRTFAVTGLLGGFTTMSAVAVETDELHGAGETVLAALYLAVSVGAGLVAVIVGELVARRVTGRAPS